MYDSEIITDKKYLLAIAKARKELTSLIGRIRNKEYKGSDYLWVGADIAIDKAAPPKHYDWWPPEDDYVVTPFCKELSWLFIQLRDIFYEEPLIDSFSKYEFFSRHANAAINYMSSTSDGVGEKEELLMATHHEAEIILKEMLALFPHSD